MGAGAAGALRLAGLGLGGPPVGWAAALKRELVYSKMATLCPDRKYELSNGQQQQAISIYFFLEGLGFRVWSLGFRASGLEFRVWSLGLGFRGLRVYQP